MNLLEILKEEGPEVKENWIPQTDQEADWYIEVNMEEIKEIEELEKKLQEKVDIYTRRLNKLREQKEFKKAVLNSKLGEYFDSLDEDKKKVTKTQAKYRLPSGDIIKKYPKPQIIRDDEKLIAWAKKADLGDYVRTLEKIEWGELKKLTVEVGNSLVLKETGEVVEGITLKQRPPIIEVKPL